MKVREWIEKLFANFEIWLNNPIYTWLSWGDNSFPTKIKEGFVQLFEYGESEARDVVNPLIDEMLKFKTLPGFLRTYLEDLKQPRHFIQLAAIVPILAAAAFFIIPSALAGYMEHLKQESFRVAKPTLLDSDRAIAALWRGEITKDQYIDQLRQQGLSDDKIEILEHISRFLPGPSDLISFSVRDVFRGDLVEKYGYDTDFDKIENELSPWLEKIGMDPDVMKLYWRAHWDLPSITLAYELLHRGFITENDLRILLKTADMAPAFVDPIIQASYSPYTRVDVRRMYELGILDREAVKRSYQDIGYDDEHAENMTEFTILDSIVAEKDLTKTETLTALSEGLITETEAKQSLSDMGYSGEEADVIISLESYKIEKSNRDREKKVISNLYYYGKISRSEAEKKLNELNVSEREKELTLAETEARIREKHKDPSKEDLAKWYKGRLISKDDYIAEMLNLGYSINHINNYLKSV